MQMISPKPVFEMLHQWLSPKKANVRSQREVCLELRQAHRNHLKNLPTAPYTPLAISTQNGSLIRGLPSCLHPTKLILLTPGTSKVCLKGKVLADGLRQPRQLEDARASFTARTCHLGAAFQKPYSKTHPDIPSRQGTVAGEGAALPRSPDRGAVGDSSHTGPHRGRLMFFLFCLPSCGLK